MLSYVNRLREEEVRRVLSICRARFCGKDILELGSGTGAQLRVLASVARSAVGLEIPNALYAADQSGNIMEYDGKHIPFPDACFDLVFSSNVIEHIKDQTGMSAEIKRVLAKGGCAIHVVPTRAWRIATSIVHYPARLLRKSSGMIPEKHGELGNWLTEYYYFGVKPWRSHFERQGWRVDEEKTLGLAYTGHCLFANRLSLESRTFLSRLWGSSTAMFVLSPIEVP